MSSEKSTAIILRLVEFSESSLIVTMMTRDFGKISAMAKGARRKKSPFEAALDLLAICRIVFLHKKSESLDLLTEAKLERRFRSASTDLERLYCGYYVAELLTKMTDEADPHPELFDLAKRTIDSLDSEGTCTFKTMLRFEMRMLVLLGHQPQTRQCSVCGNEVQGESRAYFGLIEGGRLCTSCRPGKTNVVSMRTDSFELLDQFLDDGEKWQSLEIATVNRGEVRQTMNRYIAHLIGAVPRMHGFLKKLI